MANLEVDADYLAKQGEQFNNMASIAYSIYSFLANGAARIEFPEDDQISSTFAGQWNGLVSGATSILLGFHDGMASTGTNIDNTATLYKQSNIVNSDSITAPPTVEG